MRDRSLDLDLEDFRKMNRDDRIELIYKNLVSLNYRLDDYRLHKKIQYVWLSCLTIFIGVKKFLGF